MPPKRKSPKAATANCAICNTEVENSKDESLQCQSCNQKFHRYCAGAALTEYKMYENGSPYECFHCYKVRNESTVTDLKDCIEALKSEILELRSTVQELSNKVEAAEAKNRKAEPSWSQVVRRGKKKPLKQKQGAAYAESQSTEQSRVTRQADCLTSNEPRARKLNNARKSVKAVGARKIWGTLRTTTCTAVRNTLNSLTEVSSNDLQIKRKYKTSRNNPVKVTKWWFVIRGEESMLQELEREWSVIAVQTAWKLEPVHYYEENPVSDNPQEAGSDQVAIQSTADNEHSVNLMAPSNSDHTAVLLEEPTSQAL